MQFMSPELLVPRVYDMEGAKATPQADVYAFGLVIFQVCEYDCGYQPFSNVLSLGPYRKNAVPKCSGRGDGIPHTSWGSST